MRAGLSGSKVLSLLPLHCWELGKLAGWANARAGRAACKHFSQPAWCVKPSPGGEESYSLIGHFLVTEPWAGKVETFNTTCFNLEISLGVRVGDFSYEHFNEKLHEPTVGLWLGMCRKSSALLWFTESAGYESQENTHYHVTDLKRLTVSLGGWMKESMEVRVLFLIGRISPSFG